MPPKTKSKRTARKSRKRPQRGTPRQTAKRKPGKRGAPAIAVFGDSLFAVKFKEKSGPEVFFHRQGDNLQLEHFKKVSEDLWKACANLYFLLNGEKLAFNPCKSDLEMPSVLHYVMGTIKKLVPPSFKFRIDQDDEGHYFTIYRYCEGWERSWHTIEAGPVLLILNKVNPPLHDLFLSFLRAFSESTGADLWDMGMMGNTVNYLDDHILNMEGDHDPEDIVSVQEDIDAYDHGEPARYARLIRKAKKMTPLDIQKRAQRFKKCGPIVNLIVQGCELMGSGNNICDYRYVDICEEEAGCYLDLDTQTNIIWRYDDNLTHEHESCLDAMSQDGVQEPVISVRVDGSLRAVDFESLIGNACWPAQLSHYYTRANELTEKFKNERANRNIAKKL